MENEIKDLSFDDALTKYAEKRKELTDRIKVLKLKSGVRFSDIATHLGKCNSAISDLMTPHKDHYKWSYDGIVEAIEKLEAYND